MGIGFGYYYYRSEDIEFRRSEIGHNQRKNKDVYRISGLAQYITFGLNIKLFSDIRSFIQFKKLGFNSIKAKAHTPGNNYKREFFSRTGVMDLGITLGFLFPIK